MVLLGHNRLILICHIDLEIKILQTSKVNTKAVPVQDKSVLANASPTQLHQPRLWFITGGYLVKR